MSADRVFAAALLVLAVAYGFVAWTAISAPFQYDPLGPESWPRILAVALAVFALLMFARPDPPPDWGGRATLVRIGTALVALCLYAALFEPLGFILATSLFVGGLTAFGGARPVAGAVYGLAMGFGGYLLCDRVLGLNVPAGLLAF